MSLNFLKSNAARLLTAILALQGVVLLSYSRPESVPASKPLADFPLQVSDWQRRTDGVIDPETAAVLQADDTLSRDYLLPDKAIANLFIAAFRSQRNGKAPHSPKNCLPGSGWVEREATTENIAVGDGKTIEVNRYVVGKGEARSIVYYWYQSRDRAVANEYKAKGYVVLDAIKLNRTDTALVRVVVGAPVGQNNLQNAELQKQADGYAQNFIVKVYPHLREFLPQ